MQCLLKLCKGIVDTIPLLAKLMQIYFFTTGMVLMLSWFRRGSRVSVMELLILTSFSLLNLEAMRKPGLWNMDSHGSIEVKHRLLL